MDETPQEARARIVAAKLQQRRELARLPFEEKILRVLRLQKVSRQFRQARLMHKSRAGV